MRAIGRRHRNFPRLMVPDQLVNTVGGSIHVLIIGYAFGPVQLGYVSLLFSALYLPVIPGISVPTGLPECGSLRNEPCRPYARTANQKG